MGFDYLWLCASGANLWLGGAWHILCGRLMSQSVCCGGLGFSPQWDWDQHTLA